MRAHIISKLIFKRLSKDNEIGFYNTHEKKSGVFGISANNKELIVEDLHYRVMPFETDLEEDLEKQRAIWESAYAQAIDKIINSKDNNPNLSKEEQWNIARYFTIQGFLSNDNFENNYKNAKNELFSNFNRMLKKQKRPYNMSKTDFNRWKRGEIKKIEKQFSKLLPDIGINSVNSKMREMFNGTGQYYEKALILMNEFLPITLKLENHKVFFTDKIHRTLNQCDASIFQLLEKEGHSKNEIENIFFSMSIIIVGPLTNEKLLVFINKHLLINFDTLNDINEYEIIVNKDLEFFIYEFQDKNSLMRYQKPTKYFFFNPDDEDWVLSFLNLK